MAYIGNPPISGNFQVCDAISVVNGQAAYTMQVSSANVSPESANHMLVSLNGVLQKPNSSFTISSSTITFASNLATGDVIDFILLLGNVNDIGTPSDSTVTNAKTNFTTTSSAAGLQIKGDGTTAGALQLNCEQNSHGIKLQSPAHSANQSYTLKFPTGNVTADKVLKVASVSGSGTTGVGQLSFADAGGGAYEKISNTTASGVSEVDFTSIDTSTYRDIMILTSGVQPANNDVDFRLRLITAGGVVTGGNYNYGNISRRQNGSTEVNNSANAAFTLISNNVAGNEATHTRNVKIEIFNMASTSQWTITRHHFAGVDGDDLSIGGVGASAFKNTDAVTGVRLYFSSGNIAAGTFTLYGRKI